MKLTLVSEEGHVAPCIENSQGFRSDLSDAMVDASFRRYGLAMERLYERLEVSIIV